MAGPGASCQSSLGEGLMLIGECDCGQTDALWSGSLQYINRYKIKVYEQYICTVNVTMEYKVLTLDKHDRQFQGNLICTVIKH